MYTNNIYLFNEIYTNGYNTNILDILSIIAILSGILVIISKNPIISVLFLIGLFFSISGYLMFLGIYFIGLSYLLVYVGAVSILFLFILMLINIRISELLSDTNNTIPLAIIISLAFSLPVYSILPNNIMFIYNYTSNILTNTYYQPLINNNQYYDDVLFVTGKYWDGILTENVDITSVGNIMYSSYAIWLIVTSLILLLAMVGAIVITINRK